MKSQNVIATYIWLRIKTLLPSPGTHLRAKQDLYKNSPLLPWWKKKKSKIDFLFMAIINLLLLAKNKLVRKCAIHQEKRTERI